MSTLFLTTANTQPFDRTNLTASVAARFQVSAPKFGSWLKLQRGSRSLEQIALQVRPLVQPVALKVDRSLIQKIEQGRIPSWPMLAALSRVYGVPIEETARRLTEALTFPGSSDLLRHSGERTSKPHQAKGVSDVPASEHATAARIQQLERELAERTEQLEAREAVIREVQGIARQLFAVALPDEDRQARKRAARGRRADRAAGG